MKSFVGKLVIAGPSTSILQTFCGGWGRRSLEPRPRGGCLTTGDADAIASRINDPAIGVYTALMGDQRFVDVDARR
jgi:hypothetical protein